MSLEVIFPSYLASTINLALLTKIDKFVFAISISSVNFNLFGTHMHVLSTKIIFPEKSHVNILYILKKHVPVYK